MTAKISITDHDSGDQMGPKPVVGSDPQIIKPMPSPNELEAQPSFVHPIPTSEPPLEEMANDIPSPEVPRFGTLQPKVDAHPLFSGNKEPVTKNRRWLKRTLAPVLALLVVLIILYLAIDAGLVKGYSHLPFHFFKAPATATAPTITPAKTTKSATTTPTSTSKPSFTCPSPLSAGETCNVTTAVTSYNFQQLGLSMNVLPGWEIKSDTTKVNGVNTYNWTVFKSGGDGYIAVSSSGFQGGFEDCGLTAASIKEVSPTNNPKLMFMSWSYTNNNTVAYNSGIVLSDELTFKTSNNENYESIKNSATKPGNYYICIGHPLPGFSLGLNSETAPNYARKDSISAYSSAASSYTGLSSSAQAYADIKSMLTSIK